MKKFEDFYKRYVLTGYLNPIRQAVEYTIITTIFRRVEDCLNWEQITELTDNDEIF